MERSKGNNNNWPKHKSINRLKKGGIVISETNEIAEEFNIYFAKIGTTLAAQIIEHPRDEKLVSQVPQSMFLAAVTHNEVLNCINKLKRNKAPGIDNITVKTLKVCENYIVRPLTFTINMAFSSGECPKHFKQAVVVPIHNSGD